MLLKICLLVSFRFVCLLKCSCSITVFRMKTYFQVNSHPCHGIFYLKTEATVWIRKKLLFIQLFGISWPKATINMFFLGQWGASLGKGTVAKADDQTWPLRPAYPLWKCPLPEFSFMFLSILSSLQASSKFCLHHCSSHLTVISF